MLLRGEKKNVAARHFVMRVTGIKAKRFIIAFWILILCDNAADWFCDDQVKVKAFKFYMRTIWPRSCADEILHHRSSVLNGCHAI